MYYSSSALKCRVQDNNYALRACLSLTFSVQVAVQMGKRAEKIGSQFTISVGDNFYGTGVKDVDDPRFKETYEVGKPLENVGD